jgi:hypothetical protein
MVQDLIEASVRVIGVAVLKLLSFGRYKSEPDALLLEGGVGLAVVAVAIYLVYAIRAM